MNLGESPLAQLTARAARAGIALHVPPITVRVRTPIRPFVEQLQLLYGAYDLRDASAFADIDVRLIPVRGPRRLLAPAVNFVIDGITPFEPFELSHALPLFEWGVNWVFAHRMHQHLLLHAAVVERNGSAVLLPAWPGSGKSTLAASLAFRGWRYLSDEFGIVSPSTLSVLPFPRPAALKNESIDVMRRFAPQGRVGPTFPRTRKGAVAHLRIPDSSVRRALEPASIGAVVFPDFQAGAEVQVRPLGQSAAFLKLAHNAFNYEVLGEPAFHAVAAIVRNARCCVLRYGNLDDAHAAIDALVGEALHVHA
jgi:HprK-related kinase A